MQKSKRFMLVMIGVVGLLAGCSLGSGNRVDLITPAATTSQPTPQAGQATLIPVDQPTPQAPGQFARLLALKEGERMQGDDVKAVQQRLLALNYAQAGAADGIFGPATKAAVTEFQQQNALAADGIVGEQTWARLFAADAQVAQVGGHPEDLPRAGLIFYLDPDGATIKTMRPDGSDQQILLQVEKAESEAVVGISADPSGTYLIYGVAPKDGSTYAHYALVEQGVAQPIGVFRAMPRWEPGGRRVVGQAFDENVAAEVSTIAMYDVAAKEFYGLSIDGPVDWFPDGKRLIYIQDQDLWAFDLASEESTRLTTLPATADNPWFVQQAHVWPDGQSIIFYAGQQQNVGASGNGMQWWRVPAAGGEPEEFTAPNGNGLLAVQFADGVVAYVEGAHSSACESFQSVFLRTSADQEATNSPVMEGIAEQEPAFITGLSWNPAGEALVFGAQPYRCSVDIAERVLGKQQIYLWLPGETNSAYPITPGSYPFWVK